MGGVLVPPKMDQTLYPEVLLNDDHRIGAVVRGVKANPLVVKIGAKREYVLRERTRVVNRFYNVRRLVHSARPRDPKGLMQCRDPHRTSRYRGIS